MAIDLTIIIPTYNEERRLLKTLKAYTSFFDHRLSCEYIVTDQSRDNTRQIVRHFMKRHKNVHLLCLTGRGKGGAVLEAFKISTGKFIGFTDADNSTSPQEFYKLYKNWELFKIFERYWKNISTHQKGNEKKCHNHNRSVKYNW